MSDKNKTLILVEGDHEKYVLLKMIFKLFPETGMNSDNVLVYGTDIYDLYNCIIKEYGDDWDSNDLEINLPYIVSTKNHEEKILDKRDFTDIFIVFDYERHDNFYSDEKIGKMQKHFCDSTADGVLYINYPMIEAYQHISGVPDSEFMSRTAGIDVLCGSEYKNLVHSVSLIWKYLIFYKKCIHMMTMKKPDISEKQATEITDRILSLCAGDKLAAEINMILESEFSDSTVAEQLMHYYSSVILKTGYIENGINFWTELRNLFIYTSDMMIMKAFVIQENSSCTDIITREMYYAVDLMRILEIQINSANTRNEVWVLATCLMFLANYKFYWNRH